MAASVADITAILDEITRPSLAESWDNVGLMVGRSTGTVQVILVALDLSAEVCEQAIKAKADMIVTHHPAIFTPVKALVDTQWQANLLLQMAEKGIGVYSAHTNLDKAQGGVNDALARCLGLHNITGPAGEDGTLEELGRLGTTDKPMTLRGFAERVKRSLKLPHVTVVDAGRPVHRVAVCGGSGMDFAAAMADLGVDTYVTGDIKYHQAQDAQGRGLNLIDAGHQGTELPVLNPLADRLALRLSKEGYNIKVLVAKEAPVLQVW